MHLVTILEIRKPYFSTGALKPPMFKKVLVSKSVLCKFNICEYLFTNMRMDEKSITLSCSGLVALFEKALTRFWFKVKMMIKSVLSDQTKHH